MTKEEYTRKIHDLRIKMLELQYNMRKSNIPVILILSGMTGAGKGHLSYRLNEWMDPRYIRTHAFWDETDDEKERPYLWRFFRHMPAAGEIGIFFHAWYRPILHGRILKRTNRKETAEKIQEILKLETMLAEDGCQVIKFWFYLSRNDQKKLLKAKRKSLKKLTKDEKQIIKKYNDFEKESSVILKASSTERSPWHNIDASDRKQAEIRLMETFIEVSEKCLSSLKKPENSGNISEGSSSGREKQIQEAHKIKNTSQVKSLTQNENNVTQLGQADLTLKLDPDVYKTELARLMKKIDERSFRSFHQKKSMIAVFEGWDGAGKGSAIRRVTRAMDARLYSVIPVSAPTDEELAHHYLWRFWRRIPREGYNKIFDRSWYGRVLVERVEGFASEDEWKRAYNEINEFEKSLSEGGIHIIKFWIHIDQDEQLRRFKERENTPWKQYKITEDDWRNREKWHLYESAVNDMILRTNTDYAPWRIIPGNDKKFARIEIMKEISRILK